MRRDLAIQPRRDKRLFQHLVSRLTMQWDGFSIIVSPRAHVNAFLGSRKTLFLYNWQHEHIVIFVCNSLVFLIYSI